MLSTPTRMATNVEPQHRPDDEQGGPGGPAGARRFPATIRRARQDRGAVSFHVSSLAGANASHEWQD